MARTDHHGSHRRGRAGKGNGPDGESGPSGRGSAWRRARPRPCGGPRRVQTRPCVDSCIGARLLEPNPLKGKPLCRGPGQRRAPTRVLCGATTRTRLRSVARPPLATDVAVQEMVYRPGRRMSASRTAVGRRSPPRFRPACSVVRQEASRCPRESSSTIDGTAHPGRVDGRGDRAALRRPKERRAEDANPERRRGGDFGPSRYREVDRRAERQHLDVGRPDDGARRGGRLVVRDGRRLQSRTRRAPASRRRGFARQAAAARAGQPWAR